MEKPRLRRPARPRRLAAALLLLGLLPAISGAADPAPVHDHGRDLCRRGSRVIRWHQSVRLDGLSDADVRAALCAAFAEWSAVCDITPVECDTPEGCDLLITSGPIDGRFQVVPVRLPGAGLSFVVPAGATLAKSDFPCGDGPTVQVLDAAEDWDPGRLRLVEVHELGHGLGLVHTDNEPSVMNPCVDSPNARPAPTESDARQARLRYGPPRDRHRPCP